MQLTLEAIKDDKIIFEKPKYDDADSKEIERINNVNAIEVSRFYKTVLSMIPKV